MSMRKFFKRARGKVKGGLESLGISTGSTSSLPGAQPDPMPTLVRAQSHSPSPVTGAQPPPSFIEQRVCSADDAAGETRPSANTQANAPLTETFFESLDRRNNAAQLALSPFGPAGTSLTGRASAAPHASNPTPYSHSPSASDFTAGTQNTPTRAVHSEPVAGTSAALNLKVMGNRAQSKPLDTPSAEAIAADQAHTSRANLFDKDWDATVHAGNSQQDIPAPAAMEHASDGVPKTWARFTKFQQALGTAVGSAPLKAVMGELGGIISMCEDTATARTDYAALKNELEGLFSALSNHFSGDVPPVMTAGMNNLCIAIENELDQISTKEERGAGRRYLEASRNLDEVMACYQRVKGHLERLRLNADLNIWKIVDKQATEVQLNSLNPSRSAYYNSAEAQQIGRRECTPHTRKQVLADLSHWRHDKNQESLYWLSGMAGTGKTTIAGSLCKMLDESHELGASFFCTRLRPECRDVKLILPTIAYQLARFSRPFCHALSLALERDSELHAKMLPIQLEGLIIGPLRTVAVALPQDLVVVIDALDECEDSTAVGQLLRSLVQYAPDLPLKIFVSSRPEFQIRQNIGEPKAKLILHELEASIVKEDVKLYLQTELKDYSLSICDSDLSTLVERAGVLFIYAATVVRYIGTANSVTRRQKRMQSVLEMNSSGASRTDVHIDALYTAILDSAFDNPDLEKDEVSNMKLVLDTVICAQEPLTVQALVGLLRLEGESSVQDALEPLWSVLHISSYDQLVATLHASFPDFMLDPLRSNRHSCLRETHHGHLAELCLDRINSNERQFNICGLESSYEFDDNVEGLSERVKRSIPQDLFYACRYWTAHLAAGGPSASRISRMHTFLADRLLLWMEVLNLKKQIHIGASMMQTTRLWCAGGDVPKETRDLVHEAWRFVTMFAANDISRSTVHLYVSMLACWPSSGSLTSAFRQRTHGLSRVEGSGMARRQLAVLGVLNASGKITSIGLSPDGKRIVSGSDNNAIQVWDAQTGKPLLDPLKGHTNWVRSVEFSPNGTRIVSGSLDNTIRVWDAQTGRPLIKPLKGHAGSVRSVAFSPGGRRIVSGSDDSTVRVWDARTGKLLLDPLRGHTTWINSVAFSPSGKHILSGSSDKKIRVWDARTGKLLFDPLEGHTGSVTSVSFSPDGMRIVSGSDDDTIRVWSAGTGELLLRPIYGHTSSVRSVAFSLDGMQIVSGSDDNTIRVWDTQTGKSLLDPFIGHTDSVSSVSFSSDGMRIVSGSYDSTIRVWDAHAGKPRLDPLTGHTTWVNSVAYSPDGMRIVSGSDDKTIWVWDAQTGKSVLDPLKGHTDSVNSVAFSPDSMYIVSGSSDCTVWVWGARVGKPLLGPLVGHTDSVKSVAFSPNGTHIVSGSKDKTIRVWDAQAGRPLLNPLRGHTDSVNSVAFSPDGMRIVSGSHDGTIRVWDAQTGKSLLRPLKGHTDSVNSVAFSPHGMYIVSGSSDYTVRVWGARAGNPQLNPLEGHTDSVKSVAFSPDGMHIVSGSNDDTIRVWDVQTGKSLRDPFRGHVWSVNSVAFSPNSMHIASASDDKTIRVWRLPRAYAKVCITHTSSLFAVKPCSLAQITAPVVPPCLFSLLTTSLVHGPSMSADGWLINTNDCFSGSRLTYATA